MRCDERGLEEQGELMGVVALSLSGSRRRWFQFRLSTLFLATLIVAAVLGWQRERISHWIDSFWTAEDLPDDRPWPPVTIQVTIAEVTLNTDDEFSIEMPLADSL